MSEVIETAIIEVPAVVPTVEIVSEDPIVSEGAANGIDVDVDQLVSLTTERVTANVAEVAAIAAEAKVGNLYATIAAGGRKHLDDAVIAAEEIQRNAAEAAEKLNAAGVQTATELYRRSQTDVESLRGQIGAAAAQLSDVIGGAVTEVRITAQAAVNQAAEAANQAIATTAEISDAAAAVAKATQELIAVKDSAVRTAVTQILERMANGDDARTLALIKGASNKSSPRHAHAPLLEAVVRAGVPAYLHGEAGSGKSTGARKVAEDLGLQFRHISVSPTPQKADLLGFRDAGGHFHRSGLREVVEHGGVFLFDELDSGNPGGLTVMNATLGNGHTEFPDKNVAHHAAARFVAAANTVGKGANAQYVGRNRLDAATLDRFAFVPWDIDNALEEALVLGEPLSPTKPIDLQAGGVPTAREWLDIVRGYRESAASMKIGQVVSTRASEFGKSLIEVDLGNGKTGVGVDHLINMLILKGTDPATVSKWKTAAQPPRR